MLASNETTVGIGSGQPSRLDSCEIAINKMKKFNLQSDKLVAASDVYKRQLQMVSIAMQSKY